MKKSGVSLGENLVSQGLLKPEQLKAVELEVSRTGEPFHKVLKRLRFIDENDWASFISSHFGIPRIEVLHQIIKPDLLKQVPEDLVRKFAVFPLLKVGKRLTVAMSDPFNFTVIDQLRLRTGFEIDLVLATESEIRNAIDQNYGTKGSFAGAVEVSEEIQTTKKEPAREVRREVQAEESPATKLVNVMLSDAIRDNVSDIHIEPDKKETLVRYRLDGVLREIDRYPRSLHLGVVSRIKVMASLDISETRAPQDGRAWFEVDGRSADLRISVMPTVHGENVVIRLLNVQKALLPLEKLGMSDERLSIFQDIIKKPYGIFLITGPTGSGKTTTLYAALNQINSSERNIVTIEDPVEYQLPLIRQIQVNAKVSLTFATGLRSILRQDPDVIMVGEIRDKETADIAIQAALTGHMVFSTLHTNNAAAAVSRLLDMGIEPFLISSTVVGVMAQRLIRTICKECRTSYEATDSDLDFLKTGGFEPDNKPVKLFRGKGCMSCKKSGYSGRNGLFEILTMDDEIRKLIVKQASSEQIEKLAISKGMTVLRRDGVQKVKLGITTVDEVMRVTQE